VRDGVRYHGDCSVPTNLHVQFQRSVPGSHPEAEMKHKRNHSVSRQFVFSLELNSALNST
jgi:hypothetical protein